MHGPGGVHGLGGACSGGCMVPGGSGPGGCMVQGGTWQRTPPPTATAVGGTHPTGMHSCFYNSVTI